MNLARIKWIGIPLAAFSAALFGLPNALAAENWLQDLLRVEAKPVPIGDVLEPLRTATSVRLQFIPRTVNFEYAPSSEMVDKVACVYSSESPKAIESLISELLAIATRATAGTHPNVIDTSAIQFFDKGSMLGYLNFGDIGDGIRGYAVKPGEVPGSFKGGGFFTSSELRTRLIAWIHRADVKLVSVPVAIGDADSCLK